jgi:hypothetical protein
MSARLDYRTALPEATRVGPSVESQALSTAATTSADGRPEVPV